MYAALSAAARDIAPWRFSCFPQGFVLECWLRFDPLTGATCLFLGLPRRVSTGSQHKASTWSLAPRAITAMFALGFVVVVTQGDSACLRARLRFLEPTWTVVVFNDSGLEQALLLAKPNEVSAEVIEHRITLPARPWSPSHKPV